MYLRRSESGWTAQSPAKLNLYLDILGQRDDGYHNIETFMVPLRLGDTLEFSARSGSGEIAPGEIQFDVHPALSRSEATTAVPRDESNLVVRALRLLQSESGTNAGARVRLIKRIPVQAGLGGGSSNAATALQVANRAWGLGWETDRLMRLAAELGSDVPFFIHGRQAICRGRGEQVECTRPSGRLHFVVARPPIGLSTADVYRAYAAGDQSIVASDGQRLARLCRAAGRGVLAQLGRTMRNALQPAAAQLTPWIDRLRSAFDDCDFAGHQLSGSGTAYFGLCRTARHAARLATLLRARRIGLVCATSTLR